MDLATVISQGTMKAAAEIIKSKSLVVDTNELVDALRIQVKAQYAETLHDLKAAMDCRMGEPMYRQILNVACNKMAMDAIWECDSLHSHSDQTENPIEMTVYA